MAICNTCTILFDSMCIVQKHGRIRLLYFPTMYITVATSMYILVVDHSCVIWEKEFIYYIGFLNCCMVNLYCTGIWFFLYTLILYCIYLVLLLSRNVCFLHFHVLCCIRYQLFLSPAFLKQWKLQSFWKYQFVSIAITTSCSVERF